jgi:hypothetical protein
MYDVIIIGGGISGLYTYLKLLDKGYTNIILLEQNNYFGGRIKQHEVEVNETQISFPEGAARFNKNHINVISLLKRFHLLDFRKDKGFEASIDFIDVKNRFSQKYESISGYDFINTIITKSKKYKKNELMSINFKELAYKILPREDVDYMLISCGYSGQLNYMNAFDAIKLFNSGIRTDILYWGGKFHLLINEIVDLILKKGGKLRLNSKVNDIQYDSTKKVYKVLYHAEKQLCSKNIFFCVPKPSLVKFNILKPILDTLKSSVTCKPLCRTYAIFKKQDVWFKNLNSKIVTNNELRYIIPMNSETGLIMISYTDDAYTKYWKNIKNNQRTLKEKIVNLIKETFQLKINPPEKVIVCHWDCGVAYWNPNINSNEVSKEIMNPIPNIYICGENYSLKQSWVEGALETVNTCMLNF